MSEARKDTSPARPWNIRQSSPLGASAHGASPPASIHSRHASIARLASPALSGNFNATPPVKQVPTPAQLAADQQQELPALGEHASLPGPGQSALAAALADNRGNTSRNQHSPRNASFSAAPGLTAVDNAPRGTYGSFSNHFPQSNYGSFGNPQIAGSPAPTEDPEIVKRHLVQPARPDRWERSHRSSGDQSGLGGDGDEFSSLKLQGGDVHRQVYKWTEENQGGEASKKYQRSKSFDVTRPEPEDEVLDINNIKVPGGFRRNFLRRAVDSPDPSPSPRRPFADTSSNTQPRRPQLLTNNFLEFLTLYGHFAGEELEDDDENAIQDDDYFASDAWDDDDDLGSDREPGEGSALLTPRTPGGRRRKKERQHRGNTTSMGAALLLLKSFVGTGVLFLPKAFLNGGMLFSNLVLLAVAGLSYYCFILLVNCRLKIEGSFGDIGGVLYGKYMRALILSSIVLSQIGFVSAYIVFTSENLQAFILAVSNCKKFIDIKFMVLMQLIIFLPLSLIRDIGKLGFTALIADGFILLGLLYLYFFDLSTIASVGVADIVPFNPSTWTLFIGTAIFTFEGVGLIIPIQESMRQPEKFPSVLAPVMLIITAIFLSAGALSYASFGSATKTVILLNLPQSSPFVNAVQFLYSLAILLSTPLQLFPAIRIMENELFTPSQSGKFNPHIKWKKNAFRFCLVMLCALIAWAGANDLDKFVALVGSFACVPLVYVYPPLLHLRAVAKPQGNLRMKLVDIGLCGFGLVGCAYTTALTVKSWVGGEEGKAPGYCDT
ncbi:MAG: hypothetical protein Q9160_006924 [Pyrenula sp. 1 TL-2023]